ncbi:MAG: hypothetical protein OXG35_12870 [Acidobacteria bacterium]|nr:hypothetical protein [Acidobacteriota bacterium]
MVEDGGAFAAHRPTDAAPRRRRVAFVDRTLRTEALTRTGPDGT